MYKVSCISRYVSSWSDSQVKSLWDEPAQVEGGFLGAVPYIICTTLFQEVSGAHGPVSKTGFWHILLLKSLNQCKGLSK